jgi:transglutaminase/protease-like cytokinesis protein 3
LIALFPNQKGKAGALLTWLNHNISYDMKSFFGNDIKFPTGESIVVSGLAVCHGNAVLFNTMALSVGIESIILIGHAKGLYP